MTAAATRLINMDLVPMLFASGASLVRVLVVGVLSYAGLILLLRAAGKRMLSKMNAFDFIVTVALGSVLASTLMTKSVTLADGLLGFAVLIGLQFALTWLSVRSPFVSHLIKAEPSLLFHKGEFLRDAMRRERVVETEILAAVRSQGIAALSSVEAVVLETDGSFTVLKPAEGEPATALADVTGC